MHVDFQEHVQFRSHLLRLRLARREGPQAYLLNHREYPGGGVSVGHSHV
jgi:hypothetical protein